ncbi:NAD-binding protein [Rhodotorula diobovata]|uniref:NAD-binding protein n=1 Tax=Rhodotorula diobovata TaxID=5288 RepID=A0A5C5FWE2_9BASI|nr:NAD-binding protein [Rhodotorula diobovata]
MPAQSQDQLRHAQERTIARLNQVKTHFDQAKGSGRFLHKVGIVTGAGSPKGIGRATARLLAREGAKALYVVDFDGSTLGEFADELEKKHKGLSVTAITGDAADSSLIESLCTRAAKEHGRLDYFYANAGITGANMHLPTMDEEGIMEVMRVNLLSCFLAVKHASNVMKQNPAEAAGGSIVLTASVAGIRSGAGPMDYSASKAGVINLANTSANFLAGTGIRVNAICPGLIETGMTTYTFDRARERGTLGKVGQLNPLRRFGIAEEIAQAALWLASDDSSYVNGIALPVDGGLSSSLPVVPGQTM